MKRFFLSFLVEMSMMALPLLGKGQKYTNVSISDGEVLEFLNSTQSSSSVPLIISEMPETESLVRNLKRILADSSFTNDERDFIRRELTNLSDYKWKKGMIKNARIITGHEIDKIFYKKKADGWPMFYYKYGKGITGFSVPLFTADKNKCIIFRSYSCGPVCGEGAGLIYQKVNGKWTLMAVIPDWVG
jgi:hypothetical protein